MAGAAAPLSRNSYLCAAAGNRDGLEVLKPDKCVDAKQAGRRSVRVNRIPIAILQVILIVLLMLAIQPYLTTRLLTNISNLQLGRSVFLATPESGAGFLQAAQKNFTKALSISPGDPVAVWGEARAYLLQGNFEQAAALLPVLKTRDPDNKFAFYELGFAHYKNGDEDGAFAIWRPLLPESAQYLVWRAGRFRAAGDLARQEELLILASRLDPQGPNSYYALGGLYWGQGRNDAAIATLETGARLDQLSSGRRWLALGQAEFLRGHWSQAEANLHAALDIDQDDPWAGYLLGTVLWNQHRISEARTVFQDILQDHPSYIWALVGLARIAQADQDYAQAEGLLQNALKTDPSLHLAYARLGELYLAQDRILEAQQAYQSALRLAPGAVPYLLALAQTYEQSGEADQAVALYQAVLKQEPSNPMATERLDALGR